MIEQYSCCEWLLPESLVGDLLRSLGLGGGTGNDGGHTCCRGVALGAAAAAACRSSRIIWRRARLVSSIVTSRSGSEAVSEAAGTLCLVFLDSGPDEAVSESALGLTTGPRRGSSAGTIAADPDAAALPPSAIAPEGGASEDGLDSGSDATGSGS